MKLKCLSVQQPWADLILSGKKKVENRSWRVRYRGLLGIHASSSRASWEAVGQGCLDQWLPTWRQQPPLFGALLGVVQLASICRHVDLPADLREHEFADRSPANWCWLLRQPLRLPRPLTVRGNSMLFHVDIPDGLLAGYPPPFAVSRA
jgi:hypothetical protein